MKITLSEKHSEILSTYIEPILQGIGNALSIFQFVTILPWFPITLIFLFWDDPSAPRVSNGVGIVIIQPITIVVAFLVGKAVQLLINRIDNHFKTPLLIIMILIFFYPILVVIRAILFLLNYWYK